ncbi:MAG: transcription termination factor Rho [Fusobacteriota bacterium]
MDFGEKELIKKKVKELREIAKGLDIKKPYEYRKNELIYKIIEKKSEDEDVIIGYGKLDVLPDGYGFIRETNVQKDIYVSASQIKKFSLRTGDIIIGEIRKPVGDENNFAMLKMLLVNGDLLVKAQNRVSFEELVPYYPTERLLMENSQKDNVSGRMIDLVSPIGKGQRGLIVAPPKAGKTMLLKRMANSIIENNPETAVWILLIDERPEEVTDIIESVEDAEVFASTFDKNPQNHINVTEEVLAKAKRELEKNKDIVILMDSLTRLARAYNIVIPSSGKILSGGIDPQALYYPKNFFGAARNIRDGGSLSIIATTLVETGSKMDEVIYEEFKGTGNLEINLDRQLSEMRIFPSIDIKKSGTRREELLLGEGRLNIIWKIREYLSKYTTAKATKQLIKLIKETENNEKLLNKFLKTEEIK